MDYSLLVGVDRRRQELVVGVIDFIRQVGAAGSGLVDCVWGWVGEVGGGRCVAGGGGTSTSSAMWALAGGGLGSGVVVVWLPGRKACQPPHVRGFVSRHPAGRAPLLPDRPPHPHPYPPTPPLPLPQYTWDKQVETWVKKSGILGGAGKDPTVISPRQYCRRFRAAMASYFTVVPSLTAPEPPLDPDAA